MNSAADLSLTRCSEAGTFPALEQALGAVVRSDHRGVRREAVTHLGRLHLDAGWVRTVAAPVQAHLDDSPRVVGLVDPVRRARVLLRHHEAELAVTVDAGLHVVEDQPLTRLARRYRIPIVFVTARRWPNVSPLNGALPAPGVQARQARSTRAFSVVNDRLYARIFGESTRDVDVT